MQPPNILLLEQICNIRVNQGHRVLQDFGDVEGDLLQGRSTLPILYGYKSRVAESGVLAGVWFVFESFCVRKRHYWGTGFLG